METVQVEARVPICSYAGAATTYATYTSEDLICIAPGSKGVKLPASPHHHFYKNSKQKFYKNYQGGGVATVEENGGTVGVVRWKLKNGNTVDLPASRDDVLLSYVVR